MNYRTCTPVIWGALLFGVALWPIAGVCQVSDQPARPNIVIILVDDMGFSDLGCYGSEIEGHSILPMEGRSLVPALDDRPIQREALYWEHEGNAAIRVGDWKRVRLGRGGPWELYNLKADRTELHDLAAKYPDRARELAARWEAWARRCHVIPYPANAKRKAAGAKKRQNPRKGRP